jgi:PAS domain S-box-containing protein
MPESRSGKRTQKVAEEQVECFQNALGPFVVAVETTRMPMLFTNALAPDHPIIFANDSFILLTGYDRQELLASKVDSIFAKGDDAKERDRVEAAIRESSTPLGVECRRKDGSVFLADVYINPVCDDDGKVVQHFWSFVDLTVHNERRLALERELSLQRELIHVSRLSAMGTMAATLAHEVNQPLTAIANYAAGCRMLLARDAVDAEEIRADLTAIEESAARAGAIIRQLRNMTQRKAPSRETFDLNDAVRESVELLRVGSNEGVPIEIEARGVLPVEADRVQIQQVVINLVRNGCEAAAGLPDGHVAVDTCVDGGQAIVTIEDNGRGIDAGYSADLFEEAISTKPGGMGMGLSISRTIVDAHEGRIWLAGRTNGRTRFRFSVPLKSAAETEQRPGRGKVRTPPNP